MVLEDNPVSVLTNTPIPDPSIVLLSSIVGFWLVLQHTPLAETEPLPSFVTLPPQSALVELIFETEFVVTVGTDEEDEVVKLTWLPYPVPTLLVA